MNINKELYSIYSKVNNDISKFVTDYNINKYDDDGELYYDDKMAGWPLFIKSNDEYKKADIKLLIFGRIQTGWINNDELIYGVDDISVNDILNLYDTFFNTKQCYNLINERCGEMFWRGSKKFIEMLQEKNKSIKIGYLWNNVIKLGYYNSHYSPPAFYEDIIEPYLNKIILEEIKILQPHYIVFFTSSYNNKTKIYDDVIDNIFTSPFKKDITNFSPNKLCEIILPNSNIRKCFRTLYHPSPLRQNNEGYKNDYNQCRNKIIKEITENIKMYGA